MKTLSIKQPWASLCVTPRVDNPLLPIKDIENRTWATKHRGRIYVHASGKYAFNELQGNLTQEQFNAIPQGWQQHFLTGIWTKSAIIGEVDIVDCVINHSSIWAEKTDMPTGVYMGEKPIYNWVLANPVFYPAPILNVKGKLSLWEFDGKEVTNG